MGFSDNLPYEKVGKNEPVCIADEVPFDIPESWEWVRLQNICNIVSARRVHQSDWKSSGIPFYRAREIGVLADKGKVDNDLFISDELYNDFAKSGVPHPGDLMVTAVGTLGKVYVVQPQDRFYYKDASVICFENFGRTIPEYLQLVMMSPYMTSLIKSKSTGTTVGTITIVCAKQYLIPIPPLDEQRKIIKRLDNLKLLIESYAEEESALSKLNTQFPEILKKSILQYAVQGKLVPQNPADEPASVLLERIRAEKEQLIKAGKIKRDKHESVIFRRDNSYYEKVDGIERCIDDEIPFEIPASWAWTRLFSLCSNITDGEHKTPRRTAEYVGYYLLSARNIRDGHLSLEDVDYVDGKEYSLISKRCNPKRNNILISCSGSIGRVCLVPDDGNYVMVRSAAVAVPILVHSKYLMYALQSEIVQKQIKSKIKQAVQANLFQGEIRNLIIPVPPFDEQQRIVRKLDYLLIKTKL